jgi:hypothetical protein
MRDGRREIKRAGLAPRCRSLAPATLLSVLIPLTISLTMPRPGGELLTLALHYPLFLLLSVIVVHLVPRDRWTFLSLTTLGLIAGELLLASV